MKALQKQLQTFLWTNNRMIILIGEVLAFQRLENRYFIKCPIKGELVQATSLRR